MEGRAEVENASHSSQTRTSSTKKHTGAILDILKDAAYYWKLYGETKRSHRLKKREFPQREIILLHENAHSYTIKLISEKLEQMYWTILEHPPYSPDLSSSDYHMFKPLKEDLGGEIFGDDTTIETFMRSCIETRTSSFLW